jgi:hypothetical protein
MIASKKVGDSGPVVLRRLMHMGRRMELMEEDGSLGAKGKWGVGHT